MVTPLEIAFHGLEKSEAVENRIREKFARIERHFDRITHARVSVAVPRRRAPLPKLFQVSIEIGIPGQNPIVVNNDAVGDHSHTDVMLAVKDAFTAASRQVDEIVARMDKPAKREQSRRRPRPVSDEV